MKHFLKTYWYTRVFLEKRGKLVIVAVLAGVLVFTSVFAILPSIPKPKKMLYIGRTGTFTLSTLPIDIQNKISRGLTSFDLQDNVVPDLSERWSIESNGASYRFLIKKNIHWQDGKLLVPEDVVYNFSDVETVYTPNEVVFTLKDPYSPFPATVSQPLFRRVERRIFFIIPKQEIIGLGDYRITHISYQGPRITELVIESDKESLVYRFYLTEDKTATAFKRGEIDRMENMSDPEEFTDWKTVTIDPVLHKDQYLGVYFNTDEPIFDKDVRQALNYALAKPTGDGRAISPISPTSWAYNSIVKLYDKDEQKAVELLLRSVPKSPLLIELSTLPVFQNEAESIKSQWETLGLQAEKACMQNKNTVKDDCKNLAIHVSLKLTSFPDSQNFQTMLIGQQIPKDPDQYAQFHSTQSTNMTHFKSPRIDKLLEDGRKETKQSERQVLYQDFQQFLVEDSPIIFLNHPVTYTIERKKLF